MHEDLLGYLLGALESDEMRRVEERLRRDPVARRELDEIERALGCLDDTVEPVEYPPGDLVARTLAQLPPLQGQPHKDSSRSRESGSLSPMSASTDAPARSRRGWLDWAGTAVAVAVMLGLLIPSLAQGRFEARKILCQDQLRQLGISLTSFVNHSIQHRLPKIEPSGPEAFAGVYAVRLEEAGLLEDPTLRWCPSLPKPDQPAIDEVVTVVQLHDAPVDKLRKMQNQMGGNYAYTLGVINDGHYESPRYESRSSFAVMSDAPSAAFADRGSHSGLGINVLYEDGRVEFLSQIGIKAATDHPWRNHQGKVEAGVNVDDASLAPSWRPPFVNATQR